MSVVEDREKDRQHTTFDYISLRDLCFSQLNSTSRNGDFSEFTQQIPRNLVTRAIFVEDFWRDEVPSKLKKKSGLTAEQSWFGIRSVIKGNLAIFEYLANSPEKGKKLPENVWDDLAIDDATIDQRVHAPGFETHHLRALVEVYNLYERWKDRKKWIDRDTKKTKKRTGWKDEMDLVIQAHKETRSHRSLVKYPTEYEQRIVPMEEHKIRKVKEVLKKQNDIIQKGAAEKQGRRADHNQQISIRAWCNSIKKIKRKNGHIDNIPSENLGTILRNGRKWPFRKSHLPNSGNAWRVFWTTFNRSEIDDKPDPVVIILGYSFNHDHQNTHLAQAEHGFDAEMPEIHESLDTADQLEIMTEKDLGNVTPPPQGDIPISQVPGRGPIRPYRWRFARDDEEGNIVLDDYQVDAIFDHFPLLIDGLPGTGKTSVVAKRAAYVAALSGTKKRILTTCYSNSVLDRIRKDVQYCLDNEWASTEEEMELKSLNLLPTHARRVSHYVFAPGDLSGEDGPGTHRKYQPEVFEPDVRGYNEIIVDECQDLTQLEFEFLRKFAMREYVEGESDEDGEFGGDPRRFTLAGDPLQTLEPTGFHWGRLKHFLGKARNVRERISFGDAGPLRESTFLVNYRSVEEITQLANAVDLRRSRVIPTDIKHRNMRSHERSQTKKKPYIWSYDGPAEEHELSLFFSDSFTNNATILSWAQDDDELNRSDPVMEEALRLSGNNRIMRISQRAAKGLEFPTVVLYNIFSDEDAREKLDSLTVGWEKQASTGEVSINDALTNFRKQVSAGEAIEIAFAFSRLYVTLTRARTNLHIIENKSGIDFLEKLTIGLEMDKPQKAMDFFDRRSDIVEIKSMPEFDPSDDALYDTYKMYLNKWKETKDPEYMNNAITMAEKNNRFPEKENGPLTTFDIAKLYGEMNEHLAQGTDDQISQAFHLRQAAEYYSEGLEFEKAASLLFQIPSKNRTQDDMHSCLTHLSKMTQPTTSSRFFSFVVQLNMGEETQEDIFHVLNSIPEPDFNWSKETILSSTNELQSHLLGILKKTWPNQKESNRLKLTASGASEFIGDLGPLMVFLKGEGEWSLIKDLLEDHRYNQRISEHQNTYVRSSLELVTQKELVPRQKEITELLTTLRKDVQESELSPIKQDLLATHISIIEELETPKFTASNFNPSLLMKKNQNFDSIYALNHKENPSRAILASLVSISEILEGEREIETLVKRSILSKRLRLWCLAAGKMANRSSGDRTQSRLDCIGYLEEVISSKTQVESPSLQFVNEDEHAASWILTAFQSIAPDRSSALGGWNISAIRRTAKAFAAMPEIDKRTLLTETIPESHDHLRNKEEAQEAVEEIFKLLGERSLDEIWELKDMGKTRFRQQFITDFLLQTEPFAHKNAIKWLDSRWLEDGKTSGIRKNISLLKKKLFEIDNGDFIQIVEENEDGFDAEWNNIAMEYIGLIEDIDSKDPLATSLKGRISRDEDADIMRLIVDAEDFQAAINDVEAYLSSISNSEWEWKKHHLKELIMKEQELSLDEDLPQFPLSKGLFSDPGLIEGILFGEDDTETDGREPPDLNQMNNLSRITPTRLLMLTILNSDADWSALTPILNRWARKYGNEIFRPLQERWLDAETPEETEKYESANRPQMRTMASLKVNDSPKELSLVLLIMESRMGGRDSVEETARNLKLPVSGKPIVTLLESIREKYAAHESEVELDDKSVTTISKVFIDIFAVFDPYR